MKTEANMIRWQVFHGHYHQSNDLFHLREYNFPRCDDVGGVWSTGGYRAWVIFDSKGVIVGHEFAGQEHAKKFIPEILRALSQAVP